MLGSLRLAVLSLEDGDGSLVTFSSSLPLMFDRPNNSVLISVVGKWFIDNLRLVLLVVRVSYDTYTSAVLYILSTLVS